MYNKQTTRQVNTVGKSSEFFDRLYLDWYGNLIKYAYRLTLEKSYAEEIVQETFTEAYKKVEILQRHENPVGWLYVTTRNSARVQLLQMQPGSIYGSMLSIGERRHSESAQGW